MPKRTMVDLLNNLDKYFILKDNSLLLDELNEYNNLKLSFNLGKVFLKVRYLSFEQIDFSIESIENINGLVKEIKKEIVKSLDKQKELYLNLCKKIIKDWDERPENFKRIESDYGVLAYSNLTVLTKEEYFNAPRVGCVGYYVRYNKGNLFRGYGDFSYYPKDYYVAAISNFQSWLDDSINTLNQKSTEDMIINNIYKLKITVPTSGYDNFIVDYDEDKI